MERWIELVKRLDPRNLIEPPFDLNELLHVTRMRREFDGVDNARTARWVSRFDTSDELAATIRTAWRETRLPLRDWADRIRRAAVLWDPDALAFGIYVELGGFRRRRLLQQAPLEMDYCRKRLRELVGEPPESLCELFAAAPGLMHESGIVAAMPQFLSEPMETLARGAGDPHRTISERTRADLYTWTREQCACELFWHSTTVERQNIVLSHDGAAFLYIDDVTDALSELSIDSEALVSMYLQNPSRIFEQSLATVLPQGRRIEFWRAGEPAQRRFSELCLEDKASVALRAVRRSLEGRDGSSVWDGAEHVTDSCEAALKLGSTIGEDIIERARAAMTKSHTCENTHVAPVTLLCYLPNLAEACAGKVQDLRYPQLLLHACAPCEPVYEGVLRDIEFLERFRAQNPLDDGARARVALLISPLSGG